MKKIFSIAVAFLSTLSLLASVNTLNYQAVINTPDGTPASGKEIGMRFAIVNGDNTVIAEETVVKSSADGLVEWQIGSTLDGGLSSVDWSADGLMLQVGIDLNGGKNYTSIYSSSIQSVPSAMYALRSGDSDELRIMIDNLNAKTNADLASLYTIVESLKAQCQYNSDTATTITSELTNLMSMVNELRGYTDMILNELDKSKQDIEILKMETESKLKTERDYTDSKIAEVASSLEAAIVNLQFQIDSLKNN